MKHAFPRPLALILKMIAVLLIIAVSVFLILLIWLSIREYKPEETESVTIEGKGSRTLSEGDSLRVTSWNIGYGGLDQDHDFFMDGGKDVRPKSEDVIRTNLDGITRQIEELNSDVYFLQETDVDSKRSYHVNEYAHLAEAFPEFENTFAPNYKVDYVPYPIPTIGKVESGLVSLNSFSASESQRIALPTAFSWPVRLGQLKRGLLVNRVPVSGTEKELVLVNLHLEAYDSGEGKIAQTKLLVEFLEQEYAKGNYVIAGGDFNQTFSREDMEQYPVINPDLWTPGVLDLSGLSEDWILAEDHTVPSCRLLNQPYNPESPDTQFYIIDGFLLSPNLTLEEVKTTDAGFRYADHNPVTIQVRLASPVSESSSAETAKTICEISEYSTGDAKLFQDKILANTGGKLSLFQTDGTLFHQFSDIPANWVSPPQKNIVIIGNFNCEIRLIEFSPEYSIIRNDLLFSGGNLMIDPTLTQINGKWLLTFTEIEGNINNSDPASPNGIYTVHCYESYDSVSWTKLPDLISRQNNIEDGDLVVKDDILYYFFEQEEYDKGPSSIRVISSCDQGYTWENETELLPPDYDTELSSVFPSSNGWILYYSNDQKHPGESYNGAAAYTAALDSAFSLLSVDLPVDLQEEGGILLYEVQKKNGKDYFLYAKNYLTDNHLILKQTG